MGASVFTCTFCHRISDGPTRVIGRCARLACEPCHAILVDLSICWVCGEMVCRQDECVSLGWCFWHRACYGCLLCGSRRICSGVPVVSVFEDRAEADDAGMRRPRAFEITEPPLCAMCVVEVEADVLDRDAVVRKGLRRISLVDGGLTRERWLKKQLHETEHERLLGRGIGVATQLSVCTAGRGAGTVEGDGLGKDMTATVWVDVNDPINGIGFKPSRLKPIPLYMDPRSGQDDIGQWSAVSSARDRPPVFSTERPRQSRTEYARRKRFTQ
ncbi:hypothetical protein HIM_07716 [Hirsutella minnesotensis 3608]|uniref:LIM zinc-binding domain-containing protein n=1 Tax=Hirsutella minnesotensis 3608 TaxID=1043627 RepID=A0A0F7ZTE1_9HYPO|nr:hypothetical protein HIM_07716 [Hirsutella minnesotensis 3608]